ncbi:bacteriohemerythrin [Azospirillum halopraeferens]|uniref:bacteriohemerythrin n=1 Tax=Azospirillum halopraeferens TaxID=34010 RepID=UPI000413174B|nr:bacteriohemerythrin [Azospirillum halopraeferens]
MSTYEWRPDMSVGVPDIDAEHRELFRLLHTLEQADVAENVLSDIIARLEHYARDHFAHEEELMRRTGYPGYEEHVQRHRLFVEWLNAVKMSYERSVESSFEIGETVNAFLGRWLDEHVRTEDMRYRDHIAQMRANKA